ncbi:4Fe-4S binding protein [Candidatus Desulfosporosinus nitrosoreducens]|uniref:4Fe-4S binding protein n=1 Tax=Candidatus Desulfosporosinus nitrosoreducens TaxID=3401928 RepID=UPI0035AB82F9
MDRQLCKECLLCAEVCPSKVLEIFDKQTSVEDIIQAVEKHLNCIYYNCLLIAIEIKEKVKGAL